MITETEKNAIQLAKRVFEHFTHDALPIAREIISMEREMREYQEKEVTIPMNPHPTVEEKNNEPKVLPVATEIQPKQKADVKSIRVAGPLNYARSQTVEQTEKREI